MKEFGKISYCVVTEDLMKIRKAYQVLNGILIVLSTHNPHTFINVRHAKYYIVSRDEKEKLDRLNLDDNSLTLFTNRLIKEGKRFEITEIEKNMNYLRQLEDKNVHTKDIEGMIEDYRHVRNMLQDIFENKYRFRKIDLVIMNGINKTTSILERQYDWKTQSVYGDSDF